MINEDDKAVIENNLVYQLASPSVTQDTEWIKPGKISWDWWSTLNVYGVDFKAGVNTDTYKYFIDFASKYGIEYILLDEGWSANTRIGYTGTGTIWKGKKRWSCIMDFVEPAG